MPDNGKKSVKSKRKTTECVACVGSIVPTSTGDLRLKSGNRYKGAVARYLLSIYPSLVEAT